MVPPDTKQFLRDEVAERNARVVFVQGLAGIAGLIAAQVEALATAGGSADVAFEDKLRSVRVHLDKPARVTVEARWMTAWTAPEPTSTSMVVWDDHLEAGDYEIVVPGDVPSVASFGAVSVDSTVRVFTIGALPNAVTRMVPRSADDKRLPEVSHVTIKTDG